MAAKQYVAQQPLGGVKKGISWVDSPMLKSDSN